MQKSTAYSLRLVTPSKIFHALCRNQMFILQARFINFFLIEYIRFFKHVKSTRFCKQFLIRFLTALLPILKILLSSKAFVLKPCIRPITIYNIHEHTLDRIIQNTKRWDETNVYKKKKLSNKIMFWNQQWNFNDLLLCI